MGSPASIEFLSEMEKNNNTLFRNRGTKTVEETKEIPEELEKEALSAN
jgi:hypothetical protein